MKEIYFFLVLRCEGYVQSYLEESDEMNIAEVRNRYIFA